MSEKVVSGRTRGQYGRGLDLSRIQEVQGFTFVCPTSEQFQLKLRDEKKQVINGEVVKTDFLKAGFVGHKFVTTDEETAALVRKTKAFRTGKVKELGAAKADSREARLEALRKALEEDPELAEAAASLVRQKGAKTPVIEKPKKGAAADAKD